MKKRRIIVFLMALVLLLNFLGVTPSGAWFISGGTFGDNDYQSASVKYLPALENEEIYEAGIPLYGRLLKGTPRVAEGDTADPTKTVYISPGLSIIDGGTSATPFPNILSLENFSTVPSNVRVEIDVDFNTLGSAGEEDPVFTGATLEWKKRDVGADTYWYGMNYVDPKTASVTFMPLLEAKFANAANGNTIYPDGKTEVLNGSGKYTWAYNAASVEASTTASWDLAITDASTTIMPPSLGNTQFYNVIAAFAIASDVSTNAEEQNKFNVFFSDHFAGHTITIKVMYYAKQDLAMTWQMFNETIFSLKAMADSRAR